MSTNVPVTEWRVTSGNGELDFTSDGLETLNGLQLVTLNGSSLIVLNGSYAPIPTTRWVADDPVPITEWQSTSGLSDYSYTGIYDIADTSGTLLVDTNNNNIVDTGVTNTLIPDTIWEEDDSI